ncbi:MAG: hypothetical protein LQ341_001878 [Variospora aurantia]|nr:MAG: hypothetical protein LQ341_001878 [Variospora aurantia]
MPHNLDDFATDDTFGFDFDAFMRGPADVEAMTEACVSGDLIAVQSVFKNRWLDKTVDERLDRDMFGAGGLCEAIKQDDVNLVQFLPSNVVSMQSCHFRLATEYHAYSTLQLYLDRGFDINTYMSRMDPPALSLAVNDRKLTTWFLSHGADPNATCGLDVTPLSIAFREAPLDIINLLFDHGGSIEHGQLLHFALKRRHSDRIVVMQLLLDKGAPINTVMFKNRPESYEQERYSGLGTPLHSAAKTVSMDVVDFLLSRGADPSIKDSYGELAIVNAEYHGFSKMVDRLRSLPC